MVSSSSNRENPLLIHSGYLDGKQNQDIVPKDHHYDPSTFDEEDHNHRKLSTSSDSNGKEGSQPFIIDYPLLKRHMEACDDDHDDDRCSFEISEIQPTRIGAGLLNLGNSCFLNSILQCLTHTVPLIQCLGSYNHRMPCDCDNEGFCVLRRLREHIELAIQSSGDVIWPKEIFMNLEYFSSDFELFAQEDAHEFLQSFLDKLERCLGSKNKSLDANIVEHVFGSRLVSQLRCCNCGYSSNTQEASVGLSLEIEDVNDLQSALRSFTRREKLEDEFECEYCKMRVLKEKQLMFDQAPVIATFHLKRFKNDGFSINKICKHVTFPLELNLQPFTVGPGRSSDASHTVDYLAGLNYHLYAIVEHIGVSSSYGHYIAYIRSSPNTWHKLNDSEVTSVQEEDVLSQNAYILFYAREGTPWFSSVADLELPFIQQNRPSLSPRSVLSNSVGRNYFSKSSKLKRPIKKKGNESCRRRKTK